jgi:hypothetical protein
MAESHLHNDNHDDFLEYSSHIHGEATANITLIDSKLTIQLHLPAINVFGFERQPQNQNEQRTITSQLNLLQNNAAIIQHSADCEPKDSEVITDFQSSHDNHQHTHKNDQHSDIETIYTYLCKDIDRIELSFNLFDKMYSLQKIIVQYVSDETQNTFTITPENPSITL